MNDCVLQVNDLFTQTHWPVLSAFGLYQDTDISFPCIIEGFSRGEGYGANDNGVNFWDELDEYDQTHEERFDVECYLVDESCKLTYAEFYHYMELACERYASRFPDSKEGLLSALDAYKERFL